MKRLILSLIIVVGVFVLLGAKFSGDNPYRERAIESTGVALTGGDIADVLTVAGGPVVITYLCVEITTAVSANASLIHFESDPTVGASNTDISEGAGAPDIQSAAVGDWFCIDGDSQDVMIDYANGTDLPMKANNNGGIVVPEGGIDLKLSTSDPSTGAGSLYVRYKPLASDARIEP